MPEMTLAFLHVMAARFTIGLLDGRAQPTVQRAILERLFLLTSIKFMVDNFNI